MFEPMEVRIVGESPLMLHNGLLADPMNENAKEMKRISSKRKKTDEDYEELAHAEFMGGLYVNEAGRVVVPGVNIESAMVEAAKKLRLGKQAKAGIYCDGDWVLEYDGPKDVEALFRDGRFRDSRGVRVQQSRVQRTRPIFRSWALTFTLHYDAALLNREQVDEMLRIAGPQIGLCDFRPKFGRFRVAA